MGKLLVSLALSVIIFGVVAYFCPSIHLGVQNGYPQSTNNSNSFGRGVWEKIGGKSASGDWNDVMSIDGYPYRFLGEILVIGGFALLISTLAYSPIRRRLVLSETGKINEEHI